MNLEPVIQSELSQKEKKQVSYTNTHTHTRTHTHRVDRQSSTDMYTLSYIE